MGLAMMVDKQEDVCGRGGGEENALVESLRMTYADSIGEELRQYEINFVISDPRLPENPIVYASEGFCKMSGYSREEVMGRNCRFLQGPDTDRRTVLEVRDAIREERSAQVRILNYTKEGKPFWNLFHLAPVFSKADGSVIHFVGVQTPISCQLATSLQENESIVSRQEVSRLNGFSNGFANSSMNSHRVVLPSSGMDMDVYRKRAKRAVTTCARSRGMGVSDALKPQELECLKAATATRIIVSQLVESSKGKGEVLQRRDFQCTAAGVVSSSLMLSLTRIQQSFVL
uniref:Putative LOV domain-containing protein n=1 Tax=Schistochila sp. BC-2016 TaxID=1799626 RepID=A0A126WZ16_9MARC|nr:putative LOV domain-containing protein [Schistochila sp. BC-2016]